MKRLFLQQRGIALAFSLVFLLVMTLIGVSATHTGSSQERMAANTRSRTLAFEAAEATLHAAEINLQAALNNSVALADLLTDQRPNANDDALTTWHNWHSYTETETVGHLAAAPIYVIERLSAGTMGSVTDDDGLTYLYRITARAQGSIASTIVVLEKVVRY
jgi:type IV pilus assembly protein PilX